MSCWLVWCYTPETCIDHNIYLIKALTDSYHLSNCKAVVSLICNLIKSDLWANVNSYSDSHTRTFWCDFIYTLMTCICKHGQARDLCQSTPMAHFSLDICFPELVDGQVDFSLSRTIVEGQKAIIKCIPKHVYHLKLQRPSFAQHDQKSLLCYVIDSNKTSHTYVFP